ncbi:MAG: CoA transferase subunit A [Nitrospirae bacterium]|nr:CoA transferase subunit A [Nitrospirota bacterium]
MNKVYKNADEAIFDVKDGATIMAGGFGLCGIPENLIEAVRKKGIKNLTCISNNAGVDNFGLGILLGTRQIKKMVSSYVGENEIFEKQYLDGSLLFDITPQGTLAERIRAAGAGLGGFYSPTSAGTELAKGKETRVINGKTYVFEEPLHADFAFVKAWKGDTFGNLVYRLTAQNFNPLMAMAAKITIAEVEDLVEPGQLDPNFIHTPGIFVKRIFKGGKFEKRIERRTVRKRGA